MTEEPPSADEVPAEYPPIDEAEAYSDPEAAQQTSAVSESKNQGSDDA